MFRTIGLGAVLFGLWLLLSGHFDNKLILGLGLASVILVVYIAHRMDVIDHEGHPTHLGMRVVGYWAWLLWEIVKSNIDVAKIILSPKMAIDPHIFEVHATQSSELGHVIYANSITLTPGTVTVDVDEGRMLVHALTRDAADGVSAGEMDRLVTVVDRAVTEEGKAA